MKITLLFLSAVLIAFGCTKLVTVSEPIDTITTSEAFSSDANATSAVTAIYSDMSLGGYGIKYANGATSINTGLSADELEDILGNNDFQLNRLKANNGDVLGLFWSPIYFDIYMENAAIESLQSSKTLLNSTKLQLTGEAKFLRAYDYFYLVNLFGDVPLVTSTAYAKTDTLSRVSDSLIYRQIISDLKDAQAILPTDYSISGGERIRANKWAVTALLARVDLYLGNWSDAETQASSVINNVDLYILGDLSQSFLKNNGEAILQLQLTNTDPYATKEGNTFVPPDQTSSPTYFLTQNLLNAFEPGDHRKAVWIDSTVFSGQTYYYPYKYKVRKGDAGNLSEYYTILRLGEQYLIRAEARANQNNLTGPGSAISDLNIIRNRAGLSDYAGNTDQISILTAIYHERQIELFAENGHRWLDLKRTNRANEVLGVLKGANWQSTDQLYPIPYSELTANPRLTQNAGY